MTSGSSYNMVTRVFPPPRFLQMPSVGFDITDQRIRFLELAKGHGGMVVNRFGEKRIPPGVIVSGEIKRPQELEQILKKFRREHNLEFVHGSLPEERAYLAKMDVPDVSADEMRAAVQFQLEEHVPVPPEEAVFDYQTTGPAAGKRNELEAVVSVLAKKEVEEYIELFKKAGLTPLSFEIEAQAVARAIIPQGDKETYMVLDFGGSRTGISVISGGVVRFTSTIDVGSDMVTKALEKHFDISKEEAERLKNEKGIAKNGENQEFTEALMASISILRDEINKLFIYWQTHRTEDEESSIKEIYMCGGGANLHGLPEYLSSSLRIPVSVANPWINVNTLENYVPEIKYNLALGYASVIGLALTKRDGSI